MTVQQAYNKWCERNSVLSMTLGKIFNLGWANLEMGMPCSDCTLQILSNALSQPRIEYRKMAGAASTMISVLKLAHDLKPKDNPSITFDYSTLARRALALRKDPPKDAPKREILEAETPIITPREEKKNKTMENRKKGGCPARRVCQIDPKTMKVIETFDSTNKASIATGVKNLYRGIQKRIIYGGYYWAYEKDADSFSPAQEVTEAETPERTLLSYYTDQELLDEIRRRGWITAQMVPFSPYLTESAATPTMPYGAFAGL